MDITLTQENNTKPKFDASDPRFKILILPFDKECSYQGKEYNIGEVISRRLESLNLDDTLSLVTYYLNDSIDLANLSPEKADSLIKYNNANQIVYGYYSLKECEQNNSDKICFKYRTDSSISDVLKKIENPG